jgi:hypothetical protein
MVCAEFPCQRFLIFSPRDTERSEAHLHGILNAEMTETTQPEHCDEIAGPSPAIAKTVERRDASAHQRCRLYD